MASLPPSCRLGEQQASDAEAVLCAAPQPFKLSLRGASAITHDAVSSLLRLPMLTELRIDGCTRIHALDKMRLIAKVLPAIVRFCTSPLQRLCGLAAPVRPCVHGTT